MDTLREALSEPLFLIAWGIQAAVALAWLVADLARRNREIMPLMKAVSSYGSA